MGLKSTGICFIILIVYMFIGATIFWVIEHEAEKKNKQAFKDYLGEFRDTYETDSN